MEEMLIHKFGTRKALFLAFSPFTLHHSEDRECLEAIDQKQNGMDP